MHTAAKIRDAMVVVAKQMQRHERTVFAPLFNACSVNMKWLDNAKAAFQHAAHVLRQHAS